MNKEQEKKLVGQYRDRLQDIKNNVESIKDELQNYFDSRSESWQDGEKGEAMQERIDSLDAASDSIGDAIDYLEELL